MSKYDHTTMDFLQGLGLPFGQGIIDKNAPETMKLAALTPARRVLNTRTSFFPLLRRSPLQSQSVRLYSSSFDQGV